MAKRIIQSPETKGEFKARGLVTGTAKDKFYQYGKTQSGKDKKSLKFGVKVLNDGSSVYCDILAIEKDDVYFYKQGNKKTGEKGISQKVNFSTRHLFKEEGFEPIGMKIGVEQYIDEKGALKNKNQSMFEFDAIDYLKNNLTEDMGVFIRGKMEFSSFVNGSTGDKVRMTKLVPNQISGVTKNIGLEDENYVPVNDFKQTIIFMGIAMDESDPDDKKAILSAKVVNYSSIEDVEFIVRKKQIFQTLKKNLKPYNAITVFGKIHNKVEIEEVSDDGWGMEDNSFEQAGKSFTRELLILGADPSTLDKDTYSREQIEADIEAIKLNQKAKEDFGISKNDNSDNWGDNLDGNSGDDFDEEWA